MREESIMNSNVRKITDGAMMLAIIGAVILMDRQLAGTISSMVLYLFPLPMVFYSAKYGLKDSLPVLASVFILLFILGTPQMIFFVGAEAVIGTVYGSGVHSQTESRIILFRTIILGGLVELLAMVVFASFFGYDIAMEIEEYQNIMDSLMVNTGTVLPTNFMSTSSIRTLLVVSAILLGMLEGLLTHWISLIMLKRLRYTLPPSRPVAEYYPPVLTGYLALALMMGYYYTMFKTLENELLQTALEGFGLAGLVYLIVFGIIAICVLTPRVFPKLRRFILLIIVLLFFINSLIIAVIGFLYITTDLHSRVMKGKQHATEDI